MEWRGRRGSSNIEDRRSAGGGRGYARVGGIGGFGLIALVLIGWLFGVDLSPVLNEGGGYIQQSGPVELTQEDQDAAQFVSVTLADTEEVWQRVFREQVGREYRPPTLVLFKGMTSSACGGASEAMGPFYCPADQKVYLDTSFFTTLSRQLGATGDFAAAYVVAHEVGHHVQDELGILGQVNDLRQRVSEVDSNQLSVLIELQADCLSGIWARQADTQFGTLDPGDIDEAMDAAARIGDDTLQRAAGRRPVPETFTHGSSAQRQHWFAQGYNSGQIKDCDTFAGLRR